MTDAETACRRLLAEPPASIEDGLVAESLAYAELQGGPEFAAWLAERGPATPQPSPQPVLLDRDGDHLTITLNRPECHNAVDVAMRDALVEAFALVATDPVLTVTLEGDGPSFSSGGDLREFGTFPDPETAHAIRLERLPARSAGGRRRPGDGPGPRLVRRRGRGAGGLLPPRRRPPRHDLPPPRGGHGPGPRPGRHGQPPAPHRRRAHRCGWP